MDTNRRESELSCDLYFSLYGNNRKLKAQKIKTYALYKPLTEHTKTIDNYVSASNDTNEISVSFNGRSDSRVFSFDKVFYSDLSQGEHFDFLCKSAVQGIILGLNNFLILYKLASSFVMSSSQGRMSSDLDCMNTITVGLLKELLFHVKKDENMDSSLHVKYFEVHDNKMLDLLSSSPEYRDMKQFEIPELNCVEVKDLTEKPLTSEKDIDEIFSNQKSSNSACSAQCCHSVFSVCLVKKNINCDGFEFIKVGRLTLVGFSKCRKFLQDSTFNCEDCLLKLEKNDDEEETLARTESKVASILRPAFGGCAKTAILVLLSSELYSLEKDLNVLQFLSKCAKTSTHPEIDMHLIMPGSIKEYAEEIRELQKDFDATSKGVGVRLNPLKYSAKNFPMRTNTENLISMD